MPEGFFEQGWGRFQHDPALVSWLDQVKEPALATRNDPKLIKDWLRGAGTWFVGVNALANDATGAIGASGPLRGQAIDFIRRDLGFGTGALDRAQVSICYPGFPKRMKGESDAALRFRVTRDAAHVDGLHPSGPDRQRYLEEFSGFLLGIPLTKTNEGASPLVVWEGSHKIMRAMFEQALEGLPQSKWHQVDLTQAYHGARTKVFADCPRVVVHARPGEAYVLHRMALHGVAPWDDAALAPPEGRAILYFRPEIERSAWLSLP